jgi:TIR domain
MSDSSNVPTIFISYSHKDEPDQYLEPGEIRWLTYVRSFLEPAAANGAIQLWDDRRIEGGGIWRTEIKDALERCTACVFLVSRHSLSSSFILDVEMKRMLERHHARGAHLYPIVITSTDLGTAPWLQALNLKPKNAVALELYAPGPRNKIMSELAAEIREVIERSFVDTKKQLAKIGEQPEARVGAETSPSGETSRVVNNLRFELLQNTFYHSDEFSFFATMHRAIMFMTTLTATAMMALLLSGFHSSWSVLLAGIAATLSISDLLFDVSGREAVHASLKERYFFLLGELERERPTEEVISRLREKIYRTYGEEPPTKWAVSALAWNCARTSMPPTPSEADLIPIGWRERLLRHLVSFSPDKFRRGYSNK